MQNLETGKLGPVADFDPMAKTIEADSKILRRGRQAPMFYVGEQMRLKGGVFTVQSIGRDAIILRGLPGTRPLARELTTAEQCLPALQRIVDALQELPLTAIAVLREGDDTIDGMAVRAIRFFGDTALAAQKDEAKETIISTDSA
jgi:hypothetical protein